MRLPTATTALLALAARAPAFKLNPNGNTLAFGVHQGADLHRSLQRRDAGTLSSELDFMLQGGDYYVNFTIGTPGQPMAALLDTGSADTWVPATGTAMCAGGCPLGSFDPTKSSTYTVTEKGDLKVAYVDGSVFTGDYGTDVFQINGATLNNFTIGVASNAKTKLPGQGIVGMGFASEEKAIETTGKVNPTILQSLVLAGAIESHTFSLYLNEKGTPGEILFGGIDTAKFQGELGIIDMIPTKPGLYTDFTVALSGVSFMNKNGGSDSISFANGASYVTTLDSGSSSSVFPTDIAFAIYEGLGLEYDKDGAIIPCDADVDGYALSFTFGGPNGVAVAVPLSQFIQPYNPLLNMTINGDRSCLFGILPFSGIPFPQDILLGTPFFRGAYVVYDLDNFQIALAPAVPKATAANPIAISGVLAGQAATTVSSLPAASVSAISSALPSSAYATGAAYTSGYYYPPEQTDGAYDEGMIAAAAASTAAAPAAGTTPAAAVSGSGNANPNTIPSATTVSGQATLTAQSASMYGTDQTPAGTITASPTFSGIPSSGFSLTATIKGSGSPASTLISPFKWEQVTIPGVTIVLMTFGACLFTLF